MNVQYDFTETGGFPLDQGVLNDEQNGILLVEAAVANVLGALVILSGCVVSGSTAANGVVAINGQILPFVGGTVGAKVIIVETDNDLTYFSGSILPSQIVRYATFGDDGVQNNPWADFVTPPAAGMVAALNSVWQSGDIKEIDVTEAYITANFDSTGLGTNLRLGWAICNGNNGTVNRLGMVPVQRNPADENFATMGLTGGEETHTLIATEVPELETAQVFLTGPGSGTTGIAGDTAGSGVGRITVNGTGGAAHNNLQPFIVTLFIQYL